MTRHKGKKIIQNRIVVLEGLPGVGKSTLIQMLRARGVVCIDETDGIEKDHKIDGNAAAQIVFMKNDLQKIKTARSQTGRLIVMDRGPMSTLAYNLVKHKLSNTFNFMPVVTWFEQFTKDFYANDNVRVVYLQGNNTLPYDDSSDPYGSQPNQQVLESVTLSLIQTFAKNYTIRKYDYKILSDQEELIHEILS